MYNLPNCHLSELAIDIDRASLEVQLHQDDAQKTKHKEAKKRQANQSRHRRPTPFGIEYYRHEGASGTGNDESPNDYLYADDSAVDTPRGRSRSSTWTPTRTRAPTPHPRAFKHGSEQRRINDKRTVQWTEPLEQESPEQKSDPALVTSRKKSAMKKQPTTQEKEGFLMNQKEDQPKESIEDQGKCPRKSDEKSTSQKVVQPCPLRRDRRSSIPRPKFTVIVSRSKTSKRIAAQERPPSPLIPQAVPAPLRLSQRRSRIPTIPSSASAPLVMDEPISTEVRDFSFDDKPEVIAVNSHPTHHNYSSNTTTDGSVPSRRTSYLQAKPRRSGTIGPVSQPSASAAGYDGDIAAMNSPPARDTKPAASFIPKSSSTQAFATAKSSWAEKSADTSASDHRAAKFTTTSCSDASKSKPTTVDVISGRRSSSKPPPLSTSTSSFHSATSFWSGQSTTSSCGAVVGGSSSSSSAPVAPILSRNGKDLAQTSMMSSLSSYVVNPLGRSSLDEQTVGNPRKGGVSAPISSSAILSSSSLKSSYPSTRSVMTVAGGSKDNSSKASSSHIKSQRHSRIPTATSVSTISNESSSTSSSLSYHTANSHLSGTSTSDIGASAPSSINAEYIPCVQSELWNEIMNFCSSDSFSVSHRYCDCDDCVWSSEHHLKDCSTVARVGEGKECRARRV